MEYRMQASKQLQKLPFVWKQHMPRLRGLTPRNSGNT
jgi:hypothetical protein